MQVPVTGACAVVIRCDETSWKADSLGAFLHIARRTNVPSVQGLKSGLVVQVSKAAIGVSTCGAHTPARSWPGGSVTTKTAFGARLIVE